jgi:hypothetical protein
MRRFPLALVLFAALGCDRGEATKVEVAVDAAPVVPLLPTTRADVLARFVDAAALDGLTSALGKAGLSYCGQAAVALERGNAPRAGTTDFLEACNRLPLPAQRCVGALYGGAHPEECAKVASGLDPVARAELSRLQNVGGGR